MAPQIQYVAVLLQTISYTVFSQACIINAFDDDSIFSLTGCPCCHHAQSIHCETHFYIPCRHSTGHPVKP